MRRRAIRANYDRAVVHAILDEGFCASVAVAIDGIPHVQPMLYVRDGERLILHGSAQNRLLAHLRTGAEMCVNIVLIDGLVMGSTVPDHTMNYRSLTVYGIASEITAFDAKLDAMKLVFESLIINRWKALPPLDEDYLDRHTIVFALPLKECVAKVNNSEPAAAGDTVWCGVLPFSLTPGAPIAHPECHVAAPQTVTGYRRPQKP